MLTTRIADEDDGYVTYVVRCDEHGQAATYSERPYGALIDHGFPRHISVDIHLDAATHSSMDAYGYGRHTKCPWLDDRPCWLDGSSRGIDLPASPEYGLRQAADRLTCGCSLPASAGPVRRYHESVLRHRLDKIKALARDYDLTIDEIVAHLREE